MPPLGSAPVGVDRRARYQEFLTDPSKTAAIFPLAGAVAVLATLPSGNWSDRSLAMLTALCTVAVIASTMRFTIGRRFPPWTIHIDIALGTLLISVLAAVGAQNEVNFAVLYIWVAVYVALFFERLPAMLQFTGAGVAYAVVLAVGPRVEKPVVAWVSIFGTAFVACAVVFALVSMLRRRSYEDALTGLPNRQYWEDRVAEELERARRTRTPLSLAVIDLDNFKIVNDTKGHQAGDGALREFAAGWRAVIRGAGDFVARLGGDEFGLLAPNSDEIGIQRIADRLQEVSPDGLVFSIGMATWDGRESAADLFRRADQAMYEGKRLRHGARVPGPSPAIPQETIGHEAPA